MRSLQSVSRTGRPGSLPSRSPATRRRRARPAASPRPRRPAATPRPPRRAPRPHLPYRRHRKPPYSWQGLTAVAIDRSPRGELTVEGITRSFKRWFPWLGADYTRWRDSVRHNLSQYECFRLAGNPNRKAQPWRVDLDLVPEEATRRQNTPEGWAGGYPVSAWEIPEPLQREVPDRLHSVITDRPPSIIPDRARSMSETSTESGYVTADSPPRPGMSTPPRTPSPRTLSPADAGRRGLVAGDLESPRSVLRTLCVQCDHHSLLECLADIALTRP